MSAQSGHFERHGDALAHLARRLIRESSDRCEIAIERGGRCPDPGTAVRLEGGFADVVCDVHAGTAAERGAAVIRASS